MSYVKNYDVGQINVDLLNSIGFEEPPFVQYTHELPLLSFGDVQHNLNLSLVFNYERYRDDKANSKNPFFIAPGFKLNLHKRLIINQYDVLTAFQGEDGRNIDITSFGSKFTFDDESQRIIRRTAHTQKPIIGGNTLPDADLTTYTYTVEHSDFSKENYNEAGRISSAYDKYGNVVLSYTYNTSGQLESVTFRGSKTVTFGYVSNRLDSITYNNKTTKFVYNGDGTLYCVQHYTGVNYTFTLSKPDFSDYEVDFECKASATENNSTVSYSKNLTLDNESNNYVYKVKVIDKIGNDAVNTVTYRFPRTITLEMPPFNYVDVIDNNGVETRMQIFDHKVMCSYEVQNGSPQFESDTNKYIGDVTLYNTESGSKNTQSTGVQTRNSGLVKIDYPQNNYHCWQMDISLSAVQKGCYTLSGWVKSSDINLRSKTFYINNSGAIVNGLDIYFEPNGIWQYFSLTTYIEANYIYAQTSALDSAEFKDVRFTCCGSSVDTEDSTWHMRSTEYILLYGNVEIPFDDARFYYTSGSTNTEIKGVDEYDEKQVNFADALRYKLRKKRDGSYSEVYYNNCKGIIAGPTDLKVLHSGSYISISNFDLGVKNYAPGMTSLTRITVDDNDQSSNIVKVCTVTSKSGETTEVSTEKLNKYLDTVESTSEGITNYYEYASTNCGLISKQTSVPAEVSKDNTTDLRVIVRQYNYDADLTTLNNVVDEFGKTTTYTTDGIYGVVTGVTLPDGTVVTDAYDDDKCTLTSRNFASVTNSRNTKFNYSKGTLNSLIHRDANDLIEFTFGYDKGKLIKVEKETSVIEEHEHPSNTKTKNYYPSKSSALHSQICTCDKYGRLTKIDGVVENTYDADPYWFYLDSDSNAHTTMNEYNEAEHGELERVTQGVSGKDALLAQTTDSLTSEVTKYGYYNKQLTAAITYDTSGSAIRQETFIYDDANRLSKSCFEHNPSANEYVTSDIGYVKAASDPAVDSRVSSYSYKVNGTEKAKTVNAYDEYKRVKNKNYTVGGKAFTKAFSYNKTRISSVAESAGGTTTYQYDNMNRITSINNGTPVTFEYDIYGQLVRENNKCLDKTFVYEYNNIGNVVSVKTYSYTTGSLGSVISQQSFGYDTTYPDRLTSCGGTSVSYNAMGCPTTYDGYTVSWTKGKLAKLTKGLKASGIHNYYYNYNALGQRTSRSYTFSLPTLDTSAVVAGMLTGYSQAFRYDQSGRLVYESKTSQYYGEGSGTEKKVYLYDETGIIGMVYTSETGTTATYYFQRNLLGDVIGIYNTSGTKVGGYAYDAWGNCTITLNTNGIATRNPIRYRGYYYDEDTKLYYLNARYYCPEWRRFISPDDTSYLDPDSVNGLNLYCYCNNDPVNYADPSGHAIITAIILGAVIGALVGFGGTVLVDYYDDGAVFNGSIGADGYIANTLVGAAIGAIIGGIGSSTFSLKLPTVKLMQMATANGFVQTVVVVGSTTVTVGGTAVIGAAVAGLGIAFFSKPDSGRIRFSDGTGIDPVTGKPVTDPERAYEIYRSLKDPIKKTNWRRWMKGKGWRTNHLK